MAESLHGLDYFRSVIAGRLVGLVGSLTAEQIFELIEVPNNTDNGDLALPVPKLNKFFKVQGNPAQYAGNVATQFQTDEVVTQVKAIGPFINFRISKPLLVKRTVEAVLKEGDKYGGSKIGAGKKIVVEFSSPNIAKPFHAGHLRSTIIGNFIANVHEALGYDTVRINYLGDWGKQYGLLAVGYDKYGSEEKLLQDPIAHLFEIYVKINKEAETDPSIHDDARAYFKRMEDGEKEALDLWKRFRDLSITKYMQVYDRLNVRFDVYSGESMFSEGMEKAMNVLEEKGITTSSEGATIIDLSKENLGKVVVKKKDGTTLYITRDIAAAISRKEEYHFDDMYYVVASQQELHFRQLFSVLDKMGHGDWAKKCHHISFGMVTGMSTRKGNVVFLEQILEEAAETMHEQMRKNEEKYKQISDPEKVADLVGMSAVIIQDMSARRIKDYEFNWQRMLSIEGDTGPYLQFAHARLSSIERKSEDIIPADQLTSADLSLLSEPAAIALAEAVAQYPGVIKLAHSSLEPCHVVNYAMSLAHSISSALEALRVIGAEPKIALARAALFKAARITLSNSMRLVGLRPLERM